MGQPWASWALIQAKSVSILKGYAKLPPELEGNGREGGQLAEEHYMLLIHMFTMVIWIPLVTPCNNMVLCHYLPLCSPFSFTQCETLQMFMYSGPREYQNGSAGGLQIAMGQDSIWETRKTLWKPSLRSEPSLSKAMTYSREQWDVPLVPDKWLLGSANKCKVNTFPLMDVLQNWISTFCPKCINNRNSSKLSLLFLQCWIKMSNQHNSVIGEEIKQHAEYQQVI